jgi:late control gene D protein (GPD)
MKSSMYTVCRTGPVTVAPYAQHQHTCLPDESGDAILNAVLKPYGVTFDNRTYVTYPTLDYCTQYREKDLAFASRFAGFLICWVVKRRPGCRVNGRFEQREWEHDGGDGVQAWMGKPAGDPAGGNKQAPSPQVWTAPETASSGALRGMPLPGTGR